MKRERIEIGNKIVRFGMEYLIVAICDNNDDVMNLTCKLLEECDIIKGAYYPYTNDNFNLVLYKEH